MPSSVHCLVLIQRVFTIGEETCQLVTICVTSNQIKEKRPMDNFLGGPAPEASRLLPEDVVVADSVQLVGGETRCCSGEKNDEKKSNTEEILLVSWGAHPDLLGEVVRWP